MDNPETIVLAASLYNKFSKKQIDVLIFCWEFSTPGFSAHLPMERFAQDGSLASPICRESVEEGDFLPKLNGTTA